MSVSKAIFRVTPCTLHTYSVHCMIMIKRKEKNQKREIPLSPFTTWDTVEYWDTGIHWDTVDVLFHRAHMEGCILDTSGTEFEIPGKGYNIEIITVKTSFLYSKF